MKKIGTPVFSFDPRGVARFGELRVSWSLAAAPTLDDELRRIGPSEMAAFRLEEKSAARIRACWRGNALLGDDFEVTVEWERTADGLWSGALAWSGNRSQAAIEEIAFPLVSARTGEASRLLLPANLGELLTMRGVLGRKKRRRFYGSMQWTAFFPAGKGYGFYLDCRDSGHRIKQFDFDYADGRFIHSPVHYVPLTPENRAAFAMPYRCTFGKFAGCWYEGAQIYREWALRQPWYLDRRPVSPVLREISMWVWNRGNADDVIPPVERLRRDAGTPVALDWYWWHANPYDTDYPEFWPPREGVGVFRKALARLARQGIFTQVYTNGMTWDIDTASFGSDNGRDSLQINRDKTPTAMMFNPYTRHRLAIMCGEAPEFHKKISAIADRLAGCGLPGLYLDMIGSAAFTPCRNPAHRHVRGGGSYQREGYYRYVSEIRRKHPELLLSTEYAHEMMDLFDSGIMLDSSLERCFGTTELEAVPAYTAVYHEGVTLFGSYALPDGIPPWDSRWPDADRWKRESKWHRKFPRQFFFELGRCIVWGIQPCVCNLQLRHAEDPEFADEYRFILRVAAFRSENVEVLSSWRMLSPEGFECGKVKVKFMKRGIFTRRHEANVIEKELPAVLHSFWEGPRGERVAVLVNCTRRSRRCLYRDGSGAMKEITVAPLSCLKVELAGSRNSR